MTSTPAVYYFLTVQQILLSVVFRKAWSNKHDFWSWHYVIEVHNLSTTKSKPCST